MQRRHIHWRSWSRFLIFVVVNLVELFEQWVDALPADEACVVRDDIILSFVLSILVSLIKS
jgi:hypothetical protein